MAKDHSLALRRAVVTHLRADAGVTAIVAARVHGDAGPAKPIWPFVKVGEMLAAPYDGSRMNGAIITFAVMAFARGEDGGAVAGLADAVQQRLDGSDLDLGTAKAVSLDWISSAPTKDPQDPNGWIRIIQFRAVTSDNYSS